MPVNPNIETEVGRWRVPGQPGEFTKNPVISPHHPKRERAGDVVQ